jgi:hypothetical protein
VDLFDCGDPREIIRLPEQRRRAKWGIIRITVQAFSLAAVHAIAASARAEALVKVRCSWRTDGRSNPCDLGALLGRAASKAS